MFLPPTYPPKAPAKLLVFLCMKEELSADEERLNCDIHDVRRGFSMKERAAQETFLSQMRKKRK